MPSKTLEKANIVTRQVETALTSHVQPSADEIDAALRTLERAPYQLSAQIEAIRASLIASYGRYESADDVVVTEVGEDEVIRLTRDSQRDELKSKVSSLANAVAVSYGRPAVKLLGLEGTIPGQPDRLITMAKQFLIKTQRGVPDLGAPKESWAVPNVAVARTEIDETVGRLEGTLQQVSREARESQIARNNRDKAGTQWYLELRFALDLARAVLRRAGRDELADKVLPSRQEVERLEPVVASEEPDAPTPPPEGGE